VSNIILCSAKLDRVRAAHLSDEDAVVIISVPISDILDLLSSAHIQRELA
jgi:hypothetical protein